MRAADDILLITRALAFAAERHVRQPRKGAAAEPYVNHLAEVAQLAAEAVEGRDAALVAAALLHDTIEDTPTEYEELVGRFGPDVAGLVREVTDDKSLDKTERKRLQVVNAPSRSPRAKILKLCDKTSNLRALVASPPASWTDDRRAEYLRWARTVAAGLRGVNAQAEAAFDVAAAAAERELAGGVAGPDTAPAEAP